jgi:hypothetical protein
MKETIITTQPGTTALRCPVERSSTISWIRTLFGQLESGTELLLAALREIFDESAYKRFLSRRELVSSRAAYAAFRQENEAAKARRPKCC